MSVLDKYLSDKIKEATKNNPTNLSTEEIVDKFKDSTTGFESLINPQLNDPFPVRLESLIEDLSYVIGTRKEKEVMTEIENLIYSRFGFTVDIKYGPFACIPAAILADAFTDSSWRKGQSQDATLNRVRKFYKDLKNMTFYIDRKKAKVIGVPKDLISELFFDESMIGQINAKEGEEKDKYIKQIVAIILHELGHIFTFFEVFGRTVKFNTNLLEAVILQAEGRPDKARDRLMKITNTKNTDSTKDVIYNGVREIDTLVEPINELTTSMGHHSDSEVAADSFAVKFGYGDYLAEALVDMFKDAPKMVLMSWIFLTLNILLMSINIIISSGLSGILTLLIVVLVLYLIMVILNLVMHALVGDQFPYDKLHLRIEKIKLEYIRMLRTYKLSKKEVKQIIQMIDNVVEQCKVIEESKWMATIIGHVFIEPFNFGKEKDIAKLLYTEIQRLEDNDLHYLGRKIELGNEDLETGYEDYIVITGNNEANRVLETTADEAIPELNKTLSKYGIQVDPKTKYFVLVEPIKFRTGINSIVWMISDNRVLVITTERIKTMWYEECPYIKVFNKAAVKVNETKTIFIYEINRLKTVEEIKDTKLLKIVDDVLFWFDRSYTLYDNDNLKRLDYIIKNLEDYGDKYKDVVMQLELMKDVIRRYNQEFENRRVILDAHYGNFGLDDEKHLVMFDVLWAGRVGEENRN